MRNVDIISVPKEGSVGFSEIAAAIPPNVSATAFTAAASTDRLTVASVTGYYEGMAIVLNTNSATGLSPNIVYYIHNIVGLTFTLSLAPALAVAINITVDGSGTLSTYIYGDPRGVTGQTPLTYYVSNRQSQGPPHVIYIVDGSNRVWGLLPVSYNTVPANTLVFLGNIGGIGGTGPGTAGIIAWQNYLLLFGTATVDYANISSLWSTSPATAWNYTWSGAASGNYSAQAYNSRISVINSEASGGVVVYFTTTDGIGSLTKTEGVNFNPATSSTYTFLNDALVMSPEDLANCITELGAILLIGGQSNFVYTWDRISPGYNSLLNIPDPGIANIVAVSQNAYIFAGTRGRIYITNGSGIDLYKKVPDHITGIVNPYIIWQDASFGRNQLYFSFRAYTNANVSLDSVSGVWAIDLDTDALRLQNKTTNTGYAGITAMAVEMPQAGRTVNPAGTGMVLGWYTPGSVYGVDVPQSAPYVNFESFIQTDMIPVGTYLDQFTPFQVEWKTSQPLGGNGTTESIRISFRTNLLSTFTVLGTSTATGASMVGSTTGTTNGQTISDYFKSNFEKSQWVQLLIEMSSNATTPTYNRLTEVRIRNSNSKK